MLEAVQKMWQRRETVEHPFGTMKARMGATHTPMSATKLATEMALHVLAYNLTCTELRGRKPLIAAMRA